MERRSEAAPATPKSAVDVYAKAGLSSVDDLDTLSGRLALAFLLGGAEPGQDGLKPSARDGVVPPLETAASG